MNWHARYLQQARWTEQLRTYLFNKAGLHAGQHILDLGCGTGALLSEFPFSVGLYGLDIDFPALSLAAGYAPTAALTCGDGSRLPFDDSTFDLVFCHFVLLWVDDPRLIVSEMRRVTRPGGAVLAMAEPDYGGRIDYPAGLVQLGQWQIESLRRQGADPHMGRQLAGVFSRAGLKQVESGVIGGEWRSNSVADGQELEWQVLSDDLKERVSQSEIQNMKTLDWQARENGERVLFVPTFYAWGLV